MQEELLLPLISLVGEAAWDLQALVTEMSFYIAKNSSQKPKLKLCLGSKGSSCVYPSRRSISKFVAATKKVNFRKIKLIDVPLGKIFIGCLKNCHPREYILDSIFFDTSYTEKILEKFLKTRKGLKMISVRRNVDIDAINRLAKGLSKYTGGFRWWDIEFFSLAHAGKLVRMDVLTELILEHIKFLSLYEEVKTFRIIGMSVSLRRLLIRRTKVDYFSRFPFSLMTVFSDFVFRTNFVEQVKSFFRMDLPPNLSFIEIKAKIPDCHLRGLLSKTLMLPDYDHSCFRNKSFRLEAMMKYLVHEDDIFTGTSSVVQDAMNVTRILERA